jgi:hypothetical protein
LSALLRRCGEALYGPRWQTDLAGELGVADRTIRRWSSGVDDLPAGVYTDLMRLMTERAAALDALAEECKRANDLGHP